MDKFVIRNPRNLQSSKVNSSERKHLKQTTLQSLAGVVVLEELEHAKKVLESEEESVDRKLDVLNNLKNKKPSKEVLIKVGIGRTVRKLSKSDPGATGATDPSLAKLRKLSYKIYKAWKSELERKVELQRNKVTVQSDKETERLRSAAVGFIVTSIEKNDKDKKSEHRNISEKIEREIFSQSKCLVNSQYRKLSRKIVFALKGEDLCSKVVSSALPISELVKSFIK